MRRFSQIFYDLCGVRLDYRLDPSFSKLNTKEKVAYLLYGSRSNSSSLNKDVIQISKRKLLIYCMVQEVIRIA